MAVLGAALVPAARAAPLLLRRRMQPVVVVEVAVDVDVDLDCVCGCVVSDEFRRYFEQFGAVTDVQIMLEKETRRPRGFGFVTFDSEDTVEAVVSQMHEINSKQVSSGSSPRTREPRSFALSLSGCYRSRTHTHCSLLVDRRQES